MPAVQSRARATEFVVEGNRDLLALGMKRILRNQEDEATRTKHKSRPMIRARCNRRPGTRCWPLAGPFPRGWKSRDLFPFFYGDEACAARRIGAGTAGMGSVIWGRAREL